MQVLGQCPLGSRLCLWSSPSPLTSTAEFCSCQIHGQLWPGWCPGDPWQPPTSRHTSDSDALVSATFSTPVTPGPNVHLRIISPHHSCLIPSLLAGIWYLSELIWARSSPGWDSSRISMEQTEPRFPIALDIPLTYLTSCTLLPEAREVKSELAVIFPSFPQYSGMGRAGLTFYFCLMLLFFWNCKRPIIGGRGIFFALWGKCGD